MNLQGITEGQTYKNYKEMCKLLDEKEKGGNSKKLQLENWKRYFNFKKEGQKFIIIKIYDNPLDKTDKRGKGNNSKYTINIEKIIVNYLLHKHCNATLTAKGWYSVLGMVNDNYTNIDLRKDRKTKLFFRLSSSKLKSILISSLNSLKKRKIIDYDQQLMLILDYDTMIATDEEAERIKEIESDILEQYGYASIADVFLHKKQVDFYAKVAEKVEKYIDGFESYYSNINVTLLDANANTTNILHEKLELNMKIIYALKEVFRNENEKMIVNYNTKVKAYIGYMRKTNYRYYGDMIADMDECLDDYIKLPNTSSIK